MIVVVKEVGKPAEFRKIDGRRRQKALDEIVGGYASKCMRWEVPGGTTIVAFCDDDGISKNLPINFARPTDGAPIHGTIVVASLIEDGRDWSGLSETNAHEAIAMLGALGVE